MSSAVFRLTAHSVEINTYHYNLMVRRLADSRERLFFSADGQVFLQKFAHGPRQKMMLAMKFTYQKSGQKKTVAGCFFFQLYGHNYTTEPRSACFQDFSPNGVRRYSNIKRPIMKQFCQVFATLFLAFFLTKNSSAQSDQYLHFDLVDDFVETPNASALIANSTTFSMTGWFYTDKYAYGQGMMGVRGTNAGFYMIQLDNGKIECRFSNSAGTLYEYVAPTYTIVPEKWQHFAWVFTGTKVQLYLDGVLKGSKTATGKITATNVSFAIGKSILSGFNFVYGGRADEVTLWKKALTPAEITDMMANELTGTETDLVLYYKMNQGVPFGDNTSISKLKDELGANDATLNNFALNGDVSNFGGVLNTGFQAITFPQLVNKLTTDAPFALGAAATSGLPVAYEIVSGPATVAGNTVTLTGQPGDVSVKATQPGDATYLPADEIISTFKVLDPQTFVPVIDARSPLVSDVFTPNLTAIQLAAIVGIDYPSLFSVQNVKFEMNGQSISPIDHGNKHFTGWWTPTAFGPQVMKIIATNNFGAAATTTVNFNVVQAATDMEGVAATNVWLNSTDNKAVVEASLPCFLGAFSNINAVLEVKCPTGGCGEWDRVSSIDAKTHDGRWVEIIRYITPYGTPCSHQLDVTDFMSLLNGKIAFRLNNATLDNGYLYNLKFKYKAGAPAHKYSSISVLWQKTYPFGDPGNLSPTEPLAINFPTGTVASTLKLVSTGHGWGDNNTGNAAEFHDDTHHVFVNGASTFTQHNWQNCNPNPDGCSPQNGTWYYARAGWCPGAIAPWFDYEMSPFLNIGPVAMGYEFDLEYVDECHPNNSGCVSGVTCPSCTDGFNPHLVVACNLISFAAGPIGTANVVGTDGDIYDPTLSFSVFPNPSEDGVFSFILKEEKVDFLDVSVFNSLGQRVEGFFEKNSLVSSHEIRLSGQPKGMYFLRVRTEKGTATKTLVKG